MKSATGTTPPDISTYTEVINAPDYKWTSYMNCQSPQDDQRNFNPNYKDEKH